MFCHNKETISILHPDRRVQGKKWFFLIPRRSEEIHPEELIRLRKSGLANDYFAKTDMSPSEMKQFIADSEKRANDPSLIALQGLLKMGNN